MFFIYFGDVMFLLHMSLKLNLCKAKKKKNKKKLDCYFLGSRPTIIFLEKLKYMCLWKRLCCSLAVSGRFRTSVY